MLSSARVETRTPGLVDLNHLDLNNQLIFLIKISDLNQYFLFS